MSPKFLFRAVFAVVCVASFVTWRAAGQASGSQTLIDARSAIDRIEGNDPEAKIEKTESDFNVHMRAFAAESAGLAPREAASRWLAIVDEAIAIPHRSVRGAMAGGMPVPIGTLNTVMLTLPGPAVWPEIRKIVDQRSPSLDRTALQILCARLLGDDERVLSLCKEYDRQRPKREGEGTRASPTIGIRVAAMGRLGRRLDKGEVEELLGDWDSDGNLPYLGDLLTDQEARVVVLNTIKRSDGVVYFQNSRNQKLAQQVALAHLKEFPNPLWFQGVEWGDQAYIEKLVDHYGFSCLLKEGDVPDGVTRVYLRKLLLEGKTDLAAKLLSRPSSNNAQIGPEDWGDSPRDLDRTVAGVQAQVPNRDLWDLYASAAIACGHIPAAIARLEAQLESPKTTRRVKLGILGNLIDLHCRIGDLHGVAADMDATQKVKRLPRPAVRGPFSDDDFDPSYQALKIGMASGDPGLISRGLANEKRLNTNYVDSDVFSLFIKQRRYGELEAMEITDLRKNPSTPEWQRDFASKLCEIYYHANRPSDIVTMLRDFPSWSVDDVSKIDAGPGRPSYDSIEEEPPMGFYAAWAFAKTGQTSLALRTLRTVLLRDSGSQQPFELLNEIGGASVLPMYADLSRAHPLFPMPPLWKGDLLLRLGRVREAEASVREALAIEPSGPYLYRNKLLGLLAEIARRKGDSKGAREYANRMRAIALAHRAEDLAKAGLLSMADSALRQAAAIWPEDASIQVQWAECLDKECRHVEADAHRAKAIMGYSALIGTRPNSTNALTAILYAASDRTLALLDRCVKEHPRDARAYYARGVALERSDHRKEATKDLEQAVALDPKFYLAWNELADIATYGSVSPARAQQSALTAISLDPLSYSFATVNLRWVSDLGAAYRILQERVGAFPVQEGRPIFALHTVEPARRVIDWPRLDPIDVANRFVGEYFRNSVDMRLIIGLYHRTEFPFE